MKILAIESSSLVASIAIIDDDVMKAEYTVNFKKTHSQTLLPMINEVFKMIEDDVNTIDGVAISKGPGSFTGLRIGSATAKGIALSIEKPIIEIPTLEAMAYNFLGIDKLICPIMDARRNQVYTGVYEFKENNLEIIKDQSALSIEDLIDFLTEIDRDVIFVGDGIPVFKEYISTNLKKTHSFAPPHLNRQRAGSVGALAKIYFEKGIYVSADEHTPEYIRLSQAERCLNEKSTDEK